ISLLAIALSFAVWYYFKPNIYKVNTSTSPASPENIIINMHATVFDSQGQPTRILSTPELRSYADDTSVLDHPQITIFNESEQPWEIQSVHGRTENNNEKITLWQDVVLYQAASADQPESTITTSKLDHYPQENMAETDQPITFQQPGVVVNSIGMRAYLDTEIIDLLAEVNGYYEQVE
ncbi:MAG: LPS export ABC transporter periplasmic protein LptC, partial [Gammaproteobacteria bacterium]